MAVWADDSSTTVTPAPASQPVPNSFKVLRQKRVMAGGHSISYKLITPPALPPVAAPSVPVLTPAQQALAQKTHQTLALGATVFDHRVTDLHWVTAGVTFRVFSNIDFNDFAGVGSFETTDTVYNLFFMIGNQGASAQPNAPQQSAATALPDASAFPQGQSSFIIPAGSPGAQNDPTTFASLVALETYYDANRTALHQAAEASRAANRIHEQWVQTHPPMPQPTVIHLWKIQSNNTQATGGGPNP